MTQVVNKAKLKCLDSKERTGDWTQLSDYERAGYLHQVLFELNPSVVTLSTSPQWILVVPGIYMNSCIGFASLEDAQCWLDDLDSYIQSRQALRFYVSGFAPAFSIIKRN